MRLPVYGTELGKVLLNTVHLPLEFTKQ